MADVRHPNVVMFLGFCPLPPMLVMEYMWQGSVHSILSDEKQKLRSRLYLRFLVDSAKGMVSLHVRMQISTCLFSLAHFASTKRNEYPSPSRCFSIMTLLSSTAI